jgi:outer membrane protein insertion porin family
VDAADRLLERYRRAGRLAAAVTIERRPDGGLDVRIEEGPAARVGEVRLIGARLLEAEEISRARSLHDGDAFSEDALAADVARLLDVCDEAGFPFASVSVGNFRVTSSGALSFDIHVDEGTRSSIERIEIDGDAALRPRALARLCGLEPGDAYDGRAVAEGRRRLLRSGFFSQVGEVEVLQGRTPDLVVLRVPARAARVNSAQGLAGYSGADDRVTGLFDLRLGNIAGTARRGRVRWESRGAGSSRYLLHYEEPWLLGTPLGLRGSLDHDLHEPAFTRTIASLDAVYPVAQGTSLIAGVEAERSVFPSGDRRKSRVTSTRLGIEIDRRDRAIGPREGARLEVVGRRGDREETWRATADTTEIERRTSLRGLDAGAEFYGSVGRTWVLALIGRGRIVTAGGGVVPEEERFPLGGALSLRGYREEQFRSSRVGLLQVEQRAHLSPEGDRAFVFVDAGYAHPDGGVGSRKVHVGYGVGLRVASKAGLVGMDYGLAAGEGPLDGRIHVLLEAAF